MSVFQEIIMQDLVNTPTLFDGDYANLTNTPTLFDGDLLT